MDDKTVTSALAFIPADEHWPAIQTLRAAHDKQIKRWPPHCNLLYPFVPAAAFEETAARLRRALADTPAFDVCWVSLDHFSHGRGRCTAYLRPAPGSAAALRAMQAACVAAVPHCNDLNERAGAEGFQPHLTVGQFDSEEAALQFRADTAWAPLVCRVGSLALISRAGAREPFRVLYRVPLGGAGDVVCAVPRAVASPTAARAALLQLVTGGLLREPRFGDAGDLRSQAIAAGVADVARLTPEFVLKLAVYVRDDLGIRATAGYLLALAARTPACRPFLRAYLPAAVRLPNDLCQVVAFYRQLADGGALCAALRKALVVKMGQFSTYQLGKYNNEGAVARQRAKGDGPVYTPTLKELVRVLHLGRDRESVFHVMCILGKRYPADAAAFAASRLPGAFEPERAGKRMRLPVPETWETQVSLRGNSAAVWQDLVDHNSLPYMAMLRNLRNLLQAGISKKHHNKVLRKLSDPRAVRSSRQFPFRFFSAYQAVDEAANPPAAPAAAKRGGKKPKKPAKTLERVAPALIQRYRDALDAAVKLATTFNLQPIHGSTVVCVDVGRTMVAGAASDRSRIKHDQMALLMGLMFQFASESCRLVLFSSDDGGHAIVPPAPVHGSLLARVAELQQLPLGGGAERFPLHDMLRRRQAVDSLVVLSHTRDFAELPELVERLRELRGDMLFVSVDVVGEATLAPAPTANPLDVAVSGCSDALLRFVAERGGTAQLEYVERIDEVKGLSVSVSSSVSASVSDQKEGEDEKEEDAEEEDGDEEEEDDDQDQNQTQADAKPTLKIFVSSTFLDFQAERNLLQQVVMPELQRRCDESGRHVQLLEVDLRWGITAREAANGAATPVARCLAEARSADIFVGLLGQRYGWTPPQGGGKSITELEVDTGFAQPDSDVLLYLRAPIQGCRDRNFLAESPAADAAMKRLKLRCIAAAERGECRTARYWCEQWPVKEQGLPSLQKQLLEDLWAAVQRRAPVAAALTSASELRAEAAAQRAFEAGLADGFVGHEATLRRLHAFAAGAGAASVLRLSGAPGAGSTAMLCALARGVRARGDTTVLTAYGGCTPRSGNLLDTLVRLCSELRDDGEPLPMELAKLRALLPDLLEAQPRRVLLAVDAGVGYESLLELLPTRNHANVRVVAVTATAPAPTAAADVTVSPMPAADAETMVADYLARFGKKLDAQQMQSLLRKKGAQQPLYLRLACDVLRAKGSFERLSQQISALPADLPTIVRDVVRGLETAHGRATVEAALVPLALSRAGLTEVELLRVCGGQLAPAKWLPLRSAVVPFLRSDLDGLMQFRSARVARAFVDEYARFPNQAAAVHARLARALDGVRGREAEALHHAVAGSVTELLEAKLTDLRFVRRMARQGAVWGLVDAYAAAQRALARQPRQLRERVARVGRFVARHARALFDRPEALGQLAANAGLLPEPDAPGQDWVQWSEAAEADGAGAVLSTAPGAGAVLGCDADERSVALAMADWSVVVLSLPTGTVQAVHRGHTNKVRDVSLGAGAGRVLSASADGTLRLWGAPQGDVVLRGHARAVNACAAVGDVAVSGSDDNAVRVWDLAAGRSAAELLEHEGPVTAVAMHPGGQLFASAGWDCRVIVWRLAPGAQGRSWEVYKRLSVDTAVQAVAVSPTLTKLVGVCCFDGSSLVLDVDAEQTLCEYPRFSPSPTRACAFPAQGGRLATAGADGAVRLFSVSANGRHQATFAEHAGAGTATAFVGASEQLVSVGVDGYCKVWDLSSASSGGGGLSGDLFYGVNAVADGPLFALDSGDLVAADGSAVVRGTGEIMRAAAAGPNGLVAAATATGVEVRNRTRSLALLDAHNGDVVSAIAFGRDSLATGSWDRRVCVYSSLRRLEGAEEPTAVFRVGAIVTALVAHPAADGAFIVADRDGGVRAVGLPGGRELRFGGHQAAVTALAVSPDGSRLATSCADRVARVFDVASGRELAAVGAGGPSPGTAVAFLDDRTIAVGHRDGRVVWWRDDQWLGDFVCQAAVGGLLRVEPESVIEPTHIVAADRLGRVYTLLVRTTAVCGGLADVSVEEVEEAKPRFGSFQRRRPFGRGVGLGLGLGRRQADAPPPDRVLVIERVVESAAAPEAAPAAPEAAAPVAPDTDMVRNLVNSGVFGLVMA